MRATSVKRASSWSDDAIDSVVLDYDDRHRRRKAMTGTRGLSFLLDLPDVRFLHHGDALVLEDGRLVEVLAASEPLLEIRCEDSLHLARLAWHFGNRHLLTQLFPKYLRIRRDHVIADIAVKLGASVIEIEAPFDPEGGAYQMPVHSHEHAHDHSHHHGHEHRHNRGHDHGG